jgi:hypothetical protein
LLVIELIVVRLEGRVTSAGVRVQPMTRLDPVSCATITLTLFLILPPNRFAGRQHDVAGRGKIQKMVTPL